MRSEENVSNADVRIASLMAEMDSMRLRISNLQHELPAPAATAAADPEPAATTDQRNFSADWAEYYRNEGMHEIADRVESELRES